MRTAASSRTPRRISLSSTAADGHASDAAYEAARASFGERELRDLTLAIASIDAWNRLSIAARLVPGGYQPAPREATAAAG